MDRIKVIEKPKRERPTGPKPPPAWRSWWYRTGTVVEYKGVRWRRILTGAADQVWRTWERVRDSSSSSYIKSLDGMAAALVFVLKSGPRPYDEALIRAAEEYGTSAGQMKYALSYAVKRGLVEIDYDTDMIRVDRSLRKN